jgi:thioredoxin reductase
MNKYVAKTTEMINEKFDVIIIGGSYAGLAAAMALGRALRKVLMIDAGRPCNRFTPHAHNFITHDGKPPYEIASLARQQIDKYPSVTRIEGLAVDAEKSKDEFFITLDSGVKYSSRKLIFGTGIIDLLPNIPGFSECWGKSVLHCPYCHGYEVRDLKTGIIGNGDYAFEFGSLISNWTNDLTIYTNGLSALTNEQASKLRAHNIHIVEDRIEGLVHDHGYIDKIHFENGHFESIKAIYTRPEFKQHCDIAVRLGCELTSDGYLQIDATHKTTVNGVFACGDNVTRMRTVANAVSMGTTTGMMVNKELIIEGF